MQLVGLLALAGGIGRWSAALAAALQIALASPLCPPPFSAPPYQQDANLADKLSPEDKEAIEKAVDKTVEWLDHNQVGAEKSAARGCVACVASPCRSLAAPRTLPPFLR